MMLDDFPRRNRLDKMTVAERAIYEVVGIVEAAGADVRLTDAVVLLQAARDSVADFVDGVDKRRVVRDPKEEQQYRAEIRRLHAILRPLQAEYGKLRYQVVVGEERGKLRSKHRNEQLAAAGLKSIDEAFRALAELRAARLEDADVQTTMLALAELSLERPGWLDALQRIADQMHGRTYFDKFREIGQAGREAANAVNTVGPWVPTAICSDRTLDTVTADEWRKADAYERRAFHAYWARHGKVAFMCLTCSFPTARGQASCEACR